MASPHDSIELRTVASFSTPSKGVNPEPLAREYGIPCGTGIPEAMQLINNGETITVDGSLGIVTLGRVSLMNHLINNERYR
jgi:phosphohistidine swiveling domain-containing protein